MKPTSQLAARASTLDCVSAQNRFLETLSRRVVIADGGMGTMLQTFDPTLEDYDGYEGLSDILCLTRPDIVLGIHDAYLAAGADCVFVPGNLGADVIAQLVARLDGPLNVIASARCPSPAELEAMGVARLSVGSAPARAALGLVRGIAESLKTGDLGWVQGVSPTYAEANEIFA